jgi:hypothetical protein
MKKISAIQLRRIIQEEYEYVLIENKHKKTISEIASKVSRRKDLTLYERNELLFEFDIGTFGRDTLKQTVMQQVSELIIRHVFGINPTSSMGEILLSVVTNIIGELDISDYPKFLNFGEHCDELVEKIAVGMVEGAVIEILIDKVMGSLAKDAAMKGDITDNPLYRGIRETLANGLELMLLSSDFKSEMAAKVCEIDFSESLSSIFGGDKEEKVDIETEEVVSESLKNRYQSLKRVLGHS